MTDILWSRWQADWRRMEEIARQRGWEVAPLAIAPPASEATVGAVETNHGMKVAPQLRDVLTRHSAHVAFGWRIPFHLHPLDRQYLPTMSLNRMAIWDIAHIDKYAIPNFLGWKKALAGKDRWAAPNRPEMWENQFPFYELVNGDMLTVDMTDPDGSQPVRYFSHELDVLHGFALAPDFHTFVTEMSKLGFCGTEWASWADFGRWNEAARTYYLTADSPGGEKWLAWLAQDPAAVAADEPPPAVVEETPAERALLVAARAGDKAGVELALKAGARPDVVPDSDWLAEVGRWHEEFTTALNYAVRANNIALAEILLDNGATLDTRRLVMADAVTESSLDTVRWLIARGARVDGWKDDRHWPIHLLMTQRSQVIAPTKHELQTRLREAARPRDNDNSALLADILPLDVRKKIQAMAERQIEERIERQVAAWLDRPSYLAMLQALLDAGADPDAPWDNGITMLMEADADDGELLLRAGADVDARNVHGSSALHRAYTPAKIRLLVAYGADVDALETPPEGEQWSATPLQSALRFSFAGAKTLLELKADPKKRDGGGRSTLCYCRTIDSFELIAAYGLDPKERLPDGGTLLHNLIRETGVVRAAFPKEVAFLDFLLDLGLPINAVDNTGGTILHLAAENEFTQAQDIAALLQRGADKTIRDGEGRRPVDLVPSSQKEMRALLA